MTIESRTFGAADSKWITIQEEEVLFSYLSRVRRAQ
jgi:hypothetical protein